MKTPEDFWLLLAHPLMNTGLRHEVRFDGTVTFVPIAQRERLIRLLDAPECEVSAVPRTRRDDPLSWGATAMLWCAVVSKEATRRLTKFSPAPTMVWRLRQTSRRYAAWGLHTPLAPAWIENANARLSWHLRGVRHAGKPEAMLPSPFAGEWWIEYAVPELHGANDVVGRLREAPDPNGWKRREQSDGQAEQQVVGR